MAAPINTFRFGPVSLSVWENEIKGRDGKKFIAKSFQLAKNYKDKDDNWKVTNNYKVNELVNVIQCAQAALNDYYNRVKADSTDNTEPAPF